MTARADLARTDEAQGALLTAVLLLCAVGAVAVFSAAAPLALDRAIPPHFVRHVGALLVGGALIYVAGRLPLTFWRGAALPLYAISIVALVATLAMGHSAGGARRWLALPGGLTVQPIEFAKLTTVLAVTFVLARKDGRAEVTGRQFLVALALAALPAGLSLAQPDLGSAVILCVLAGTLLLVAGARVRHLAAPAVLGAAFVGSYVALRPYALKRWTGFLDPWSHASTEGFQLVQSYVAFGRGGLNGVGIGNGSQKLFYLPEAHNDFILSVVAEETGLIGVWFVLGAFVALLLAGLRIALASRNRFAFLSGAGMTVLLTLPAILNAAVVMGLLPTKGLTLPFLSYGRSSLLISCVVVGLLVAVARDAKQRGRSRAR